MGGTCQLTVRAVCFDEGFLFDQSFTKEFRVQLTRLGEYGKNGKIAKIAKIAQVWLIQRAPEQATCGEYARWRTTPQITRSNPSENLSQSHEALQNSPFIEITPGQGRGAKHGF